MLSDDSVRSQGSEETLSPNQDGTFSYGAASKPIGSDIVMETQSAKFFKNLERVDSASVVTGAEARPRPPDNPRDVELRPLSDTTGPGRPVHTEYRDFFNIEPDTPVFKMPRLPAPRMIVTEMSATRTDVTLRHTTHEVPMAHDRRSSSRSSTSQPRTRMATGDALSQSSSHSSVQEWLQQVRPGTPPPTPTVVTSQAVSKLPIGATASVLAPQRSRSSRHSHDTRYSCHSSRPSVAIEVLDFTSKVTDNLLRVAESCRIDAANREEPPKHEALAREQCQRQYAERQRKQAEQKEKILRQEASEREQRLAREALEREKEAAKGYKIWRKRPKNGNKIC